MSQVGPSLTGVPVGVSTTGTLWEFLPDSVGGPGGYRSLKSSPGLKDGDPSPPFGSKRRRPTQGTVGALEGIRRIFWGMTGYLGGGEGFVRGVGVGYRSNLSVSSLKITK